MVSERPFHIDVEWLGGADAALAQVTIRVGPKGVAVTEVDDTIAQTVRQHINVSAEALARWLVINWWRLRWEGAPRGKLTSDWLHSHSLASIGEGYAWPAVTFTSDSRFIRVRLQAEDKPDVASVRYLQNVDVDIPAPAFEAGLDEFLTRVESRLGLRGTGQEFTELLDELRQERTSPDEAKRCRWQAVAGIDPGEASDEWLTQVEELEALAGPAAVHEALATAALPRLARESVAALKDSASRIQVQWAEGALPPQPDEQPWQYGCRQAQHLRQRLGLAGPLKSASLEGLVHANLASIGVLKTPAPVRGGYRHDRSNVSLLLPSRRPSSQRFYIARIIGASILKAGPYLSVTDAATALQKYERAFAQEFLCPWAELDAFTQARGMDEDAVSEAAEHFEVSEQVVLYTLVSRGKLGRDRLVGS